MSILYIRPLSGRKSNYGKITDFSQNRKWLCHSDSRYETDYAICNYGWTNNILPIPYVSKSSSINSNTYLLCTSLEVAQVEKSPQHYIITASWDSEPNSLPELEAQKYSNPLDRPAKISWQSKTYNKPCVYDNANQLILNSAGEPFDPPAEFDQSRWNIRVSKSVTAVPSWILDYTDGVNNAAFTIQGLTVGQYQAKIMSIELSEEQSEQVGASEISYYTFSYTMELRKETWKLQLLDQGWRQKKPGDATKRVLIQDDSTPPKNITKPWPLDGSGNKLSNPTPANAVIKKFDVYNYVNFGVLPGINGN